MLAVSLSLSLSLPLFPLVLLEWRTFSLVEWRNFSPVVGSPEFSMGEDIDTVSSEMPEERDHVL